jgi:hypothetical protein
MATMLSYMSEEKRGKTHQTAQNTAHIQASFEGGPQPSSQVPPSGQASAPPLPTTTKALPPAPAGVPNSLPADATNPDPFGVPLPDGVSADALISPPPGVSQPGATSASAPEVAQPDIPDDLHASFASQTESSYSLQDYSRSLIEHGYHIATRVTPTQNPEFIRYLVSHRCTELEEPKQNWPTRYKS